MKKLLLAVADALEARTMALEGAVGDEEFDDEAERAAYQMAIDVAGVTALLFSQAIRDALELDDGHEL